MSPTNDRHPQAHATEPPEAARVVDAFLQAITTLEDSGDLRPMAALYSDQASVGNVLIGEKFHGSEGASQFWAGYRRTFDQIQSSFHNRIVTDRSAALEWTSEGTLEGGAPFHYDGVSIIEFDGDKITAFRAYFNARELGHALEEQSAPRTRGELL